MNPPQAIVIAIVLTAAGGAAAGDAVRGKALYESRCAACHSLDYNGTGPAHRGVYGRQAGRAPDYVYSAALAAAQVVWTDKNLDRWLANPEKFIPGQKMGFSVPAARDRADLIAYLKRAAGNIPPPSPVTPAGTGDHFNQPGESK